MLIAPSEVKKAWEIASPPPHPAISLHDMVLGNRHSFVVFFRHTYSGTRRRPNFMFVLMSVLYCHFVIIHTYKEPP